MALLDIPQAGNLRDVCLKHVGLHRSGAGGDSRDKQPAGISLKSFINQQAVIHDGLADS